MTPYELLSWSVAILIIAFLLACPICASMVASAKNRDSTGWFFIGLLFGPFGLVAAAGVPALEPYETRRARRGQRSNMKLCQYCCEPVREQASVCPHCTSVLEE